MASPKGKLAKDDVWDLVQSFGLAMLAALVAWALEDGLNLIETAGWVSPSVVAILFSVFSALQKILKDTRPEPNTPTRPPRAYR